jgi:5-methylcytosine-specific restriction protein A
MKVCTEPGCPVLVDHGRCPAHAKAKEQARPSAHKRGYTREWSRYSKRRLAKYPTCVGYPAGVHVVPRLATLTDHIISAQKRPDLFWEPTNHQSLCGACNTRKAVAEEGGFGH